MTPPLHEVLAAVAAMDRTEFANSLRYCAQPHITREYRSMQIGEFEAKQISTLIAYCRTLKPGSVVVPVEDVRDAYAMLRAYAFVLHLGRDKYAHTEEAANKLADKLKPMLAAAQPPALGGEA